MNKEDSVPLYRKIVSFFFFFDFLDLVWPLNDERRGFQEVCSGEIMIIFSMYS